MSKVNVKSKFSKKVKSNLISVNPDSTKSRKELRKEKRLAKKARKNAYFSKKFIGEKIEDQRVKDDSGNIDVQEPKKKNRNKKKKINDKKTENHIEEKKKMRILQLKDINDEEDKVIKKLEKRLKLNRRKSKTIPKSFISEGLDYLLEICDSEERKKIAVAEQNLNLDQDSGSDFEEDFSNATGGKISKIKDHNHKHGEEYCDSKSESYDSDCNDNDISNEEEEFSSEEGGSDRSENEISRKLNSKKRKKVTFDLKNENSKHKKRNNQNEEDDFELDGSDDDEDSFHNEIKGKSIINKEHGTKQKECLSRKKNKHTNNESSTNVDRLRETNSLDESDLDDERNSELNDENSLDKAEYWEDIYGRTRDKKGNVVTIPTTKYIPPHLRKKEENSNKNKEFIKLKRQMKGLINRLAENNMKSIAFQIEEMYMSNTRNDMNESLTELLFEALVTPILTPERLIMEHDMLVVILHANVGSEVGSHFLEEVVMQFHNKYKSESNRDTKELDNLLLVISHLYNFKVFNCQLIFNILDILIERFEEKEIDLILLVLKCVGFALRKANPLGLKEFILNVQKKASAASDLLESSRVRFMLDTLLAIKNNNVSKIQNYDPSHLEHLKKMIKTFIRKGNYVSELNISLQDLLNVEQCGRWWIVGSAWRGNLPGKTESEVDSMSLPSTAFTSQMLELAKKQRMNTDTRKNIFCTIMTSEDYQDAFEKLMCLGLKNQEEREIINVTVDCCLQEKDFNLFYAHLALKFCYYDRKFQMALQFLFWDKFKEMNSLKLSQITNLACLLKHLVVEKGLPLSVLKVIQFADLEKPMIRFMRKVLLNILLCDSEEAVTEVFHRIILSPKLHLFRESIRLFIHQFLLRNTKSLSQEQVSLLQNRAQLADKILMSAEKKLLL